MLQEKTLTQILSNAIVYMNPDHVRVDIYSKVTQATDAPNNLLHGLSPDRQTDRQTDIYICTTK